MGSSRQEYWSGLLFPSLPDPGIKPRSPALQLSYQATGKSESESPLVVSDSLPPYGIYSPHGILQARMLEWGAFPFSRGFPNPGIEPRSPALQADSLPAEPQGNCGYN